MPSTLTSTNIAGMQYAEQGSDPATPASNLWRVYFKSGGMYHRDDAGTVKFIPAQATVNTYTQTYSTAARTVNAYTSDAESGAYTGIDNAQAATPYAQLTDLNALRTAYETLRASHDNLLQVVSALIDDLQSSGLIG